LSPAEPWASAAHPDRTEGGSPVGSVNDCSPGETQRVMTGHNLAQVGLNSWRAKCHQGFAAPLLDWIIKVNLVITWLSRP
jgi:hypothetical protein